MNHVLLIVVVLMAALTSIPAGTFRHFRASQMVEYKINPASSNTLKSRASAATWRDWQMVALVFKVFCSQNINFGSPCDFLMSG